MRELWPEFKERKLLIPLYLPGREAFGKQAGRGAHGIIHLFVIGCGCPSFRLPEDARYSFTKWRKWRLLIMVVALEWRTHCSHSWFKKMKLPMAPFSYLGSRRAVGKLENTVNHLTLRCLRSFHPLSISRPHLPPNLPSFVQICFHHRSTCCLF